MQALCTLFKDAENHDRKSGCAFSLAWGLDTDTFLNAFSRFTNRRGVPSEVISDRGSNFVGAVGELKKLVSQRDRQQLQSRTAELGITWRCNPPAAPHFGGAHEVMVKTAKKAIYAVDSSHLSLLKPQRFIHVNDGERFTISFHECGGDGSKIVFLPNSRPKWTSEFRDLKVGDVVIVVQPDTPRGRRPLGRIVEVYPGRDGHARVAKVACGVRTVVRPNKNLIPLGID
ncbi:hypothetical protein ACROYT_G025159 [Oculina patagonica]